MKRSTDTAHELRRKLRIARRALQDTLNDLRRCDWRCEQCHKDPRMKDTDIFLFVSEGLRHSK